MELPTRTLPDNSIAIIKISAMSLCTVSFTAFPFFFLRHASNAHVTPGETRFRGTESGGLNSAPELAAGATTPPDALGWPSPSWSSAVLGKGGACKTCKSGALRQNILPGKRGRGSQRMDLRFWERESSILNSFISEGKKGKKMI